MRILLVAISFAAATAYPCNYTFAGVNYDASPLASSTDYQINDQNNNFWINICQPVVVSTCGSNSACCQQWDPNSVNGHASLGAASTATFGPPHIPGQNGQGFTIQFTGGDAPYGSSQNRSFEIDFVCDTSAGKGSPVYQGEQPQLHYNFMWQSQYACAAAPPPPPPPPSPCTGLNSCTGCTSDVTDGCLWCLDSSSCIQGPVGTNETCSNWVKNSKFCPAPKCTQAGDCASCTALGGCGWCLDSTSCIGLPANSNVCEDLVTAPPFCPSNSPRVRPNAKIVIN